MSATFVFGYAPKLLLMGDELATKSNLTKGGKGEKECSKKQQAANKATALLKERQKPDKKDKKAMPKLRIIP